MKVTSALLFALEFEERNSTKAGSGPNAREIVKTGSAGSEVILDGSIDEVIARLNEDGVELPEFIAILMEQAANIAGAQTAERLTARFASALALAVLSSGLGSDIDGSLGGFPKL